MIVFLTFCDSRVHGGVAVYVKRHLGAQQLIQPEDGKVRGSAESVWVEIPLRDGEKLLVAAVYRSPSSSTKNDARLNQSIMEHSQNMTHVVIVGDFNHPEANWESESSPVDLHHKASVFLETVWDVFLYQHVKQPTHFRGDQTPNILDLVFTNEEGMVEDLVHQAPLGKSHHQVLKFDNVCYMEKSSKSKTSFNYLKGDHSKLKKTVREQNLMSRLEGKTTSESWTCFKQMMDSAINECIPKYSTCGGILPKQRRPLWCNEKAVAKIKKKRKAYQRYMQTREGKDYLEYAKARNQAKGACRQAT